ncbi:MAG: hypothetical protein KIT09_22725, partial [Bryobacteraceae bacterium]|nr:hypothetical protein [Bryobacteraceae bacterium]
MSGRWLNLKILEIGEFCLFKRNFADQTTLMFTGDSDRTVQGLDYLSFSPGMLPGLLRSLRREHWDIVVCYPPARTLWDCRQAPARGAIDLVRRVEAFRPLGTYAIRAFRRRLEGRLVVLDYNDEATIPTPALPLLDACNAYFKRELPTDFAKAFRAAARRYRTPGDVVVDPFFQRNVHKLRPISAAVPESVARRAQEARGEKTTDLFFAGSTVNSTVRSRGFELLKALQGQGYVLD